MPVTLSNTGLAAALAVAILMLAACSPDAPAPEAAKPAEPVAAAPPPVPEGDPATATVERASPPMVQGVASGKFEPGNPVAEATTGAIDIQDNQISGSNGASFSTERVALVSADDQYSAGQRYADPMMVEPRQAVELRRVIEETRPTDTPANALCGAARTGYIAMAKVMEGDTEVVKLIALSGSGLPAAAATDIKLCAATNYVSKAK
jgi:hypothetical protein